MISVLKPCLFHSLTVLLNTDFYFMHEINTQVYKNTYIVIFISKHRDPGAIVLSILQFWSITYRLQNDFSCINSLFGEQVIFFLSKTVFLALIIFAEILLRDVYKNESQPQCCYFEIFCKINIASQGVVSKS